MHRLADAVSDEFPDYAKSRRLYPGLYSMRNISEPLSHNTLLNGAGKRLFGHLQQTLGLGSDLSDWMSHCCITEESVFLAAEIKC